MKNAKKLLALLLALAMCVGVLASCSNNADQNSSAPVTESNQPSAEPANDTLVIAEDGMDGKFSPFFYTAVPDETVVNLTQLTLLGTDRNGAIVEKGIEGETREYNGTDYTYTGIADLETVVNDDNTVDYNITLKEGVLFSDGHEMNIDDVIFSMYVLSDPTYDGSSTFFSLPIEGMEAYRSGMSVMYEVIANAGRDNTDFTYWTEEQQTQFWSEVDAVIEPWIQEIVDYCVAAGAVAEGATIAEAAAQWGYADLAADATAVDFFNAIIANYPTFVEAVQTESAGSSFFEMMESFNSLWSTGIETGESAPNISGIERTGDYSMTVHMTKVDATALLQFTLMVAPMHYYGDESLYDYDNNSFGFTKGDLSVVREVTGSPMGAGPYVFNSYENGVVSLSANSNYWKGEPKIAHINVQFTAEADKISGVSSGTLDIATPSFDLDKVDEITSINGTEDFDGPVITIRTTQYLGYGYIGMNADNISVGRDPGSEQSKDLRKAIATVLSVYRDVVIDSYYGEYATVINYPISNTSWAAPQVTDEGYQVAFSVDVNGNPIYTDGMTDDEKYAAAKEAALGYFKAAGYTVENGKITAAPEGAKMEYEIVVPGGGIGDHPNFMIISMAKDALAEIGFNLIINDVSDGTVTIGNNLNAGTAELWTMAWSATPDPDMTQIYYSDVANGGANAGGSSHYYGIKDENLDNLIMEARASLDQTYRKVLYKECLDIIADWACEIPCYQRVDCTVFSSERVNTSTITPDMTPFWGWINEVELLELN